MNKISDKLYMKAIYIVKQLDVDNTTKLCYAMWYTRQKGSDQIMTDYGKKILAFAFLFVVSCRMSV